MALLIQASEHVTQLKVQLRERMNSLTSVGKGYTAQIEKFHADAACGGVGTDVDKGAKQDGSGSTCPCLVLHSGLVLRGSCWWDRCRREGEGRVQGEPSGDREMDSTKEPVSEIKKLVAKNQSLASNVLPM